MTIEVIACPRLNGESIYSGGLDQQHVSNSKSVSEVFVKFDENEDPRAVMCPNYNPENRTCDKDREKRGCTYFNWEKFPEGS
jgi:hypothetical protein